MSGALGMICLLHRSRNSTLRVDRFQGCRSVQERLGHATVGITLDTYSHVAPHMQEEATAGIDVGLVVSSR